MKFHGCRRETCGDLTEPEEGVGDGVRSGSSTTQRRFQMSSNSSSSSKRVPVTILTGFLGSGKTTLLNHILTAQHGRRIAVIENEFGEVGVDDALLKTNRFNSEEQIFEMNNGCICCTVRKDLIDTLKKIKKTGKKLDCIIIETTGLADPAPVCQTFLVDDEVSSFAQIDAVITVVDAKHVLQHLDEVKPEGVENESVEQCAFADRFVLNKIDLVDEEQLKAIEMRLKSINQNADIIRANLNRSSIDIDRILGLNAFSVEAVLKFDPEFLVDKEHQHDASVTSVGLKFEGDLMMFKFNMLISEMLETLGPKLFRYKGVLSFAGMKQKFVFQGVHMLFSGTFTDDEWPENSKRENRFCFIGRDLPRARIEEMFRLALHDGAPLRFKVGDKVLANVTGGLKPGTVIKVWDEGHPYRIRMGGGVEVHAPLDEDAFVQQPTK